MTSLNVVTICGSLRKGSFNAALARQLAKFAPAGLAIAPAPSIEAIPLYNQDIRDIAVPEAVDALAQSVRQADGVIIITPEYNWSIPGTLKNAIDWLSKLDHQPFNGKPVAIQSASPGPYGGTRMQYLLRQALNSVYAELLVKPEVFVTAAAQKFAKETLELIDPPTIDFVKQQLAAFEKFIRKVTGKA